MRCIFYRECFEDDVRKDWYDESLIELHEGKELSRMEI